jgi:prepilin-type N-terminal cleavage/methylation domain-containing protein
MNFRPVSHASSKGLRGRRPAGFTLVEFLIAMAIFMVVSGAVFAMFANNAPYFNRQQNFAAVNIALQNVVSQLQLDLVNAGTGYYPGTVIPSWPIGVTISNQPAGAGACNDAATFTYTAACFDTLNVLTINPNTPPSHPTNSAGSTASTACSLTTASPFYIQANTGQTPAQTAAGFTAGDQVILVKSGGGGGGTKGPNGSTSTAGTNGAQINTFVLTGSPVVGPNNIALPFVASNADGTNSAANDPLDISTSNNSLNLGTSFCAADWVMKLEPTTYKVDVSNAQNPKLTRVQGGKSDIIAEQIIGFKIGAATWNANSSATTPTYSFYAQNASAASPSGYSSNFALVRSVRVTLVGRTNPNPDPTYKFRNTFDNGPYQVLGATVVINPRNMTMNNN